MSKDNAYEDNAYIGETAIQIGQHGFINQPKEIIDYIKYLQKENEFLKLSNPEMNLEHFRVVKENKRKIDNLRQENKRLNNIINELEKYIKNNKVAIGIKKNSNYAIPVEYVLDKLQELKGDDKE